MKKIIFVIAGIALIFAGCANRNPLFTQATQFTSGKSGVSIHAALASILAAPIKKAAGYATPSQYSIAVSSVKLLKSLDDASPYVAYDSGSIANTVDMDLKTDASQTFGTNLQYPPAGTYTHLAYTLLYIKQTCTYYNWPNAGANQGVFRAFASTYGNIQPMDLQVYDTTAGVWKWDGIEAGLLITRASRVYQVDWDMTIGWKENNTYYVAQKDPAVIIVPLSSPVIIPSNPTGLYVGTMSFDITNKLKWNDRDGNGVLGTGDENDSQNNFVGSQINPLPPKVTVTFTKQ